jgi:amino acid transporter
MGSLEQTLKPVSAEKVELRRTLSLPLITFYGLGTILGAGIYVLVGKVAGAAGMYAPVSFVLAATTAGLSAFTYMELCSRYPLAARRSTRRRALACAGFPSWSVS